MINGYTVLLLLLCLSVTELFAQSLSNEQMACYRQKVSTAGNLYDSSQYNLYEGKVKYKQSADVYEEAFICINGRAYPNDRYNAACSYALSGNKKKALHHLFKLAENPHIRYADSYKLTTDPDLVSLYNKKRWKELLSLVEQNKAEKEKGMERNIVAILDTVLMEDIRARNRYLEAVKLYDPESERVKELIKHIIKIDSVNLLKVSKVLDEKGWLGPENIGKDGSNALFLVIQHSPLKVQEKYLPMMKEAVKKGDAIPGQFAMLQDRVAIRQGRRQIYGSQIKTEDDSSYVLPLIEPQRVNERRAEVGLSPLEDYVEKYGIIWHAKAHEQWVTRQERIKWIADINQQAHKAETADSLFKNKMFLQAIDRYQTMLSDSFFPAPNVYHKIADCFAELNEPDSTAKYMLLALKKGKCYQNKEEIYKDTSLSKIVSLTGDSGIYEGLIQNIKQKRLSHRNCLHRSIRDSLITLEKGDQKYRKISGAKTREQWQHQKQIDSHNRVYLEHILDSLNIWPGYAETGYYASGSAFMIVQHSEDSAFQVKCLRIMRKAIAENNMNLSNYAFLLDRHFTTVGDNKQLFGSQVGWQETENGLVPYPKGYENISLPKQNECCRRTFWDE